MLNIAVAWTGFQLSHLDVLDELAWHCRCVCSNERAVVLMMKGADPVYQLDLRADPPCIKSHRPGLRSCIHQRHMCVTSGAAVDHSNQKV